MNKSVTSINEINWKLQSTASGVTGGRVHKKIPRRAYHPQRFESEEMVNLGEKPFVVALQMLARLGLVGDISYEKGMENVRDMLGRGGQINQTTDTMMGSERRVYIERFDDDLPKEIKIAQKVLNLEQQQHWIVRIPFTDFIGTIGDADLWSETDLETLKNLYIVHDPTDNIGAIYLCEHFPYKANLN